MVLVTQDGLRAAAEYVVHGEYLHTDEGLPPADGQTYALPGGAFFDIRDDRIARVTNYYNLDDWIAQVGPAIHDRAVAGYLVPLGTQVALRRLRRR